MSDTFGTRDSHLEALETLNRAVGPSDRFVRGGGYLSPNEYAQLIYYWAGEAHEPVEIEAVIVTLANAPWVRSLGADKELAIAGAVEAFCEHYHEQETAWRSTYPELFRRVSWAKQQPAENEGWNDYHVVRWFVLRRARKEEGVEILDQLLDRIAEGGTVAYQTRIHVDTWRAQCKPFDIAWGRAVERRRQAMIVEVPQ